MAQMVTNDVSDFVNIIGEEIDFEIFEPNYGFSEGMQEYLSQLKEMDKDIICLRYGNDFSDEEISTLLGMKPDAVRKRLSRARMRLAEIIRERGEQMDNYEKKADELLQLLGEELAKGREKAMELEDQPEREFIPITKADRTKKRRRHLRQICAIFLCGIMLAMGITMVSSDAVRAKLFGFFFEDKAGYSDLSQTEPVETKILYPTYLPEGYEKVSEEDIGVGTDISYRNEEGDVINLLQITDPDMEESFDTETTKRKSCIVGDCQGYYMDSGGTHILIWEENGVYMKITATLDEETMVRIGSSLK